MLVASVLIQTSLLSVAIRPRWAAREQSLQPGLVRRDGLRRVAARAREGQPHVGVQAVQHVWVHAERNVQRHQAPHVPG